MAQVTRSILLNAPLRDVWALISPFQALPDWHPAVACSLRDDRGGVEHRKLGLKDGAEIVEKLLGSDGHSVGYSIVSSPLPVADYRAVLSGFEWNGATFVTWVSTFEKTAENADEIIAGVYESGLAALKKRFG